MPMTPAEVIAAYSGTLPDPCTSGTDLVMHFKCVDGRWELVFESANEPGKLIAGVALKPCGVAWIESAIAKGWSAEDVAKVAKTLAK